MGNVTQLLVFVAAVFLAVILTLKSVSLFHGAIWAFGAGGTSAAEEAEALAASGHPIDWEAIERRHHHRSLIQSRLAHVKPRPLQLTIASTRRTF